MRYWRIATQNWALDTGCEGARRFGGRWNPIGMPALYAGTTIELCALEKFVHLAGIAHPPLVLVAVDIPDAHLPTKRLAPDRLPPGWADLPVSGASQGVGRDWLRAAQDLVLLVPSAIIPEATNAVINPAHPAFLQVRLSIMRPFSFDARLFKP